MVFVVLLEQETIILLLIIQPIIEKVRLTKGLSRLTTAMSLLFTRQTLYVSKVK